ncbi:collagen-like protein [Labilibaculum manganireducens]|nr:collagen-like protein [Labilibaculum manganireducens]
MKTSKLYFFAVAFMALSISMVSCSGDDGEVGLLGPKGDKGEQGAAGEVGPAGTDGSIIYSGEGEPAAAVGAVSDYYLDVATGMLYGPKVNADNWTDTDGFSLKGTNGTNGADGTNGTNGVDGINGTNGTNGVDGINGTNGTNGTNGSKILSGEGVPGNTIGNTGDFYLDKATCVLYGPAVTDEEGDTSWGAGLELKGADGNANVKTFKYTASVSNWTVYSNIATSYTKTIIDDIDFPALNQDVYENGIVLVYWKDANSIRLLPLTKLTNQKNFLTREGWIFKNSSDDRYILRLQNTLKGMENMTELLVVEDVEYQIKLITGQAAVQLEANKGNQLEFDRLVESLN